MYVTANLDRRLELEEDRLFHEDLSGDLAEGGDVLLFDFNILST